MGIKSKFNPFGTDVPFPVWETNVSAAIARYVSYSISSTHDVRSYWVDYTLIKPYPKDIRMNIELELDREDYRYYDKRRIYFYNKDNIQIGFSDFVRTLHSFCEFTPLEDVYFIQTNLGDWYRTGGWANIVNIYR